ncbi:MAG: hypothetical protein E6Q76_19685 [Rhizobium sp.]|nr:MAG: hypothetical protein E6Q76_19685 [Rhizobium sp.]
MNLTADQIKAVIDAVFAELESRLSRRPLLLMGLHAAHAFVDDVLLANVARKFQPPPTGLTGGGTKLGIHDASK